MRLVIRPRPGGIPRDLGRPALPGSKSHTQRAMLIAGLGAGQWDVSGALAAEDTEFLALALQSLGARFEWPAQPGGTLRVTGRGPKPLDGEVFVGENGTAARALSVLAPMLGGRLAIDGREGLHARPMGTSVDFLRTYGATVRGSAVPMIVDGRQVRWPAELTVNGAQTTQVATGALLGQALRPRGWLARGWRSVRVEGAPAFAYLDVTARVLELAGCRVAVDVDPTDGGLTRTYRVRSGVDHGGELAIPVDPSTRAFPRALAAMHGIREEPPLPGPGGDPHPDWGVDQDIADLTSGADDVTLAGLSARPDCVPILAALAATRPATTRITGVPNLRVKESDRLAAMAAGLTAAGVSVEEQPDGITIRGPLPEVSATADPIHLPAAPDHRIVMSLALLGTLLPCGVAVDHSQAVRKSWPGFFEWLEGIAEVRLA